MAGLGLDRPLIVQVRELDTEDIFTGGLGESLFRGDSILAHTGLQAAGTISLEIGAIAVVIVVGRRPPGGGPQAALRRTTVVNELYDRREAILHWCSVPGNYPDFWLQGNSLIVLEARLRGLDTWAPITAVQPTHDDPHGPTSR